ncbi:unnamed protein product [Clavelina lepadiformis]|uniref:Uncharacterized protein n=1 Tax=Clavelina lepadiformis TaxID=159417 RepID=A0ABP0GLV7_CLALP
MHKINFSTLEKLYQMHTTLQSCIGPNARTKLIGNNDTGEVQVGSSSSLLVDCLLKNTDDEILKLILSTVKEHIKVHYDFGLHCTLLCTCLVEEGVKINTSNCLVAECFRCFMRDICYHLDDESHCPIVEKIDINKMKPLIQILISIATSKPVLLMKKDEAEEFSIAILKGYLKCMSTNARRVDWPVFHFQEGCVVKDFMLYDGLLLDLHHYTPDCIKQLFIPMTLPKIKNVIVMNLSLTIEDLVKCIPGKIPNHKDLESFFNNKIKDFIQRAVKSEISVLFNQKIIGETFKMYFKKCNILVIDRIGMQAMDTLTRITKAKTVSHLDVIIEHYKGLVDEITVVNVNDKAYIHIMRTNTPVCSIVVCYTNPAILLDLKHTCWAAVSTLEKTLRTKKVLRGGQFENYFVMYLEKKYCSLRHQELPCSMGQFQSCLRAFTHCLKFVANCNSSCQLENVFDCYDAKLNAFVVAVQTAALVLGIKYQIKT